jgi:arylsulfatase A-like enzyme
LLLALTYVILGSLLRLGLLAASAASVSWGVSTFGALAVGFGFDLLMAWFLTLPMGLLCAVWPAAGFAGRWSKLPLRAAWVFGAFLFSFWKIAEILFWEEFGVRFNFIAVDYLVYTQEVVKNIRESYNLPLILGAVVILAAGFFLVWRAIGLVRRWEQGAVADASPRWRAFAWLLGPLVGLLAYAYVLGHRDLRLAEQAHAGTAERTIAGLRHMGDPQPGWANSYDTELAKNGEYAFLAAFWANQLEWKRFYPSRPDAVAQLRKVLLSQGGEAVSADQNDITRRITAPGPARRLNVIQITVESLSAEFLGCYGAPEFKDKHLTPNLDRIARESLWFRHCYAGGTRTVRGMEGLTLSIPPIPGQSVLRRKGCENLGTLGSVLKAQGYDTAFIYGGDGFFDNMNYFFGANGYRIVDLPRQEAAGKKPTFGNAWGACDEDAFNWSLEAADKAHAAGKPFHHFVMTTSNHRPYTWPAGRIDEKLVGRDGGVAYTDFAIGAFLKAASGRPWFKDTVFVIVADHCASVAGKRELEIRKYEIPLFIWSPGNIPARQFEPMMSQIDTAPTVLGLLKISYLSRFVGDDALRPGFRPRAFISNYQKIAVLHDDGRLTVLKPVRQVAQYRADLATGALAPLPAGTDAAAADEAVIYYQGADELFNHGGLANPVR